MKIPQNIFVEIISVINVGLTGPKAMIVILPNQESPEQKKITELL
jgi:hypothetical protein